MLNSFIDDMARTAKDTLDSLQKAPADAVIAQVALIAKYSNDGSDIGIPWSLWMAYVNALEGRQMVFAGIKSTRPGLSAPVITGNETGQVMFTTAAQTAGVKWVYPVIK